VSPGSFFQSSPASAELLVGAVRRAVAGIDLGSTRMIDAYGGVGLFAATIGRDAAEVVLVEVSPSSCADAIVNLADVRATVVRSTVEDWPPVAAGVVIADPARSGLDRIGVASLVATDAETIVLVSCDAASLGRDARLLEGSGYSHRGTEVLDVFPNTSHVEAVSRFDRAVTVRGDATTQEGEVDDE
jgi:23S rRNA (uracil1939-C5)-methyltransferase